MVGHTLRILQQILQDFKSVSDHFGTLCIKGLKHSQVECTRHLTLMLKCYISHSECYISYQELNFITLSDIPLTLTLSTTVWKNTNGKNLTLQEAA